jgi:L-amino acid N-acyltransferase YncA
MKAEVRELTADDAPALSEFFRGMTAQDRTFFFQDVQDPAVAGAWAADGRLLRRCALDDGGRILAFAALRPGVEWSSHVAELVLVVAPGARRRGLGRTLARAMLVEAVRQGHKKVTVMIAADNVGPIEMFRGLGFEGEALLRDQLRSPEDGELRDMVILAHLVDEQWSAMLTGGFGDAVG